MIESQKKANYAATVKVPISTEQRLCEYKGHTMSNPEARSSPETAH